MSGEDARDAQAELRHTINNMLNALSMQAELGLHFVEQGEREAAEQALRRITTDCKRYSEELRALLGDGA